MVSLIKLTYLVNTPPPTQHYSFLKNLPHLSHSIIHNFWSVLFFSFIPFLFLFHFFFSFFSLFPSFIFPFFGLPCSVMFVSFPGWMCRTKFSGMYRSTKGAQTYEMHAGFQRLHEKRSRWLWNVVEISFLAMVYTMCHKHHRGIASYKLCL